MLSTCLRSLCRVGVAAFVGFAVSAGVISSRAQTPGPVYVFSHFAGSNLGGPGAVDGTGAAARFNYPGGAAVDASGNIYLADTDNHTIRKITAAGVVTTLAGTAGQSGSVDGTGAAARFYYPQGVAVDAAGNVYVADSDNHTIRKITPAGVVTTVAGQARSAGNIDGTGASALFYYPCGLAVDGGGNLYVADTYNQVIRKVTPAGVVTTVAGTSGMAGSADGTGNTARFNYPYGIALDGGGNLYVADTDNQTIRKVTSSGVVTTLAGSVGSSGSLNGTGSAALFSYPHGVTVDSAGTVYVADSNSDTIRKVTSAGVVTTLAGAGYSQGFADGTGAAAHFSYPNGLAVDNTGNVYVADTSNHLVRKVTSAGVVTTLAGTAPQPGSADGTGTAARFFYPYSVAADGAGNLYVADTDNQTIRKITSGGVVTTLAGSAGQYGSTDGTGVAARFGYPNAVAVDAAGNLYVADSSVELVRKITPAGVVTTLAGSANQSGTADGTGSAARFNYPQGVAVDASGNVYVADTSNHTIRKIAPGGVVTTFAGMAGQSGSADGTGSAARFDYPRGLAVDSAGNIYVADSGDNLIRKITPAGIVTTLAGTAGYGGSSDGTGSVARFSYPLGVAVDSAGYLYVADADSHLIRKITPAGAVTTVGGVYAQAGLADGVGATAQFYYPGGIAVDSAGKLYVADTNNHAIRLGVPVIPATITTQPQSTAPVSVGASANFSVVATGDGTLTYQWAQNGTPITGATNTTLSLGAVTAANAGSYTVTVSNAVASVTSIPAILELIQTPVLLNLTTPTTISGVAGQPAALSVAVNAYGALTYQWYQGLAGDTSHPVSGATASTYTTPALTAAQSYWVSVSNQAGSAASATVTVTVNATYVFSHFAGSNLGGPGSADGTGAAARFNYAAGAAVDAAGNIYLADADNHTIRKITAAGVVSTLAGTAGQIGNTDGTGAAARFYYPRGVAVDAVGNVYVADTDNHTIRKITAAGVVTTLAGAANSSGSADGTGTAARFYYPSGIAVDGAGNLYIADTDNHTIRRLTAAGVVTTVAGTAGSSGSGDGTGASARFYYPYGIAADGAGNLYVADTDNSTIRKITSAGVVTTLAGSAGSFGSSNGTGSAANFDNPHNVAVDNAGNVYVADSGTDTIRKITAGGVVTTLAGAGYNQGIADGTGAIARFSYPNGVAVDSAGNVYVADTDNFSVRKITAAGTVTTLAGTPPQPGSADSTGTAARFFYPGSVAVDGAGNLYVADTDNQTIRKITSSGVVTTLAGSAGQYGSADGTGAAARFGYPNAVAADAAGNLYVADSSPGLIRKITPAGVVTTLAGSANQWGSADGIGTSARFSYPQGVAVDAWGTVYVADTDNCTIRKIAPGGVVTTLAGAAGQSGSADGTGSAARFSYPHGLTVDSAGNVYVADSSSNLIRKITPAGVVTTLAGTAFYSGRSDGTGSAARFTFPVGVAVDSAGYIYVADSDNHSIRKITAAGVVTTIGGVTGQAGLADGAGSVAQFFYPGGIAVDNAGKLYVADTNNHAIRLGLPVISATIVTQPQSTAPVTAGSNASFSVVATGDGPLSYQWAQNGTPLAGATNATLGFGAVTAANAGSYTVTVSNAVATVTSIPAILELIQAPVLGNFATPTTIPGVAGQSATLSVLANAYGTVTYQWYQGQAGNTSHPISGATSATYTTPALTAAQSYWVSVSNQAGTAASATVTVTLNAVYVFSHFAGSSIGGVGSADGVGGAASFNYIYGTAVDTSGNVYVADSSNNTIRKITAAGVVTTLAGTAGQAGSIDGTGGAARFNYPRAVTVDPAGNVYVADANNYTIRKITPAGVVTTLAGAAGSSGSADGTGGAARFYYPYGIAVDGGGTVYVADTDNHTIRKITAAGAVTTLAGTAGVSGSADGTGATARFYYPSGVAVDGTGNVYVGDTSNQTIRAITPAGVVTTLAGTAGSWGTVDGIRTAASFDSPKSVAVDGAGNIYVADNADTIRKITPGGVVTTLAGSSFDSGIADGVGSAARFNNPNGVAVDSAGNVYVADTNNFAVRKVTAAGLVTTFAGTPPQLGSADGTGTAARFFYPAAAAVDGAGNLYVADTDNDTIRKITSSGVVTTLAGSAGQFGSTDGTGSAARFGYPGGVTVDVAGNLYVADSSVGLVRKITPAGVVTTLAGSANQWGSADGIGSAAQFSYPEGVAVDAAGNVYVADTDNYTIRKIASGGVVTTFAGTAGQSGSADGAGSAARFSSPAGLAIDSAGNLYVADSSNCLIRKITPAGVVSTLAGTAGLQGSSDGIGTAARFSYPHDIAVDLAGNVYVADSSNQLIRKITPAGVVTTVGGTPGQFGAADGAGPATRFYYPDGIAVDSTGRLYVVDTENHAIRLGTPVAPAAIVTQPQSTAPVTVGSNASFSVVATGDGTLSYQWSQNGTPLAGATSATLSFAAVTAANAGSYTVTVSNTVASVTSVPAILELIQTPFLANLATPTTISGVSGQSAVLSVVANAYGTVTYQWYQGLTGDTSHPVSGATASTYTTPALTAAQSYWVSVSNQAGTTASATVTVTVNAVYVFSHFAGSSIGGIGSVDATGTAARFNVIRGIAMDTSGNLYVADSANHTIRKITAAGVVTTLAGTAGQSGNADGTGAAARFNYPRGVTVDTAGNVYVADTNNYLIRKITPAGVVTTLAGTAGSSGSADGTGTSARFYFPCSIAVDGAGNLYVADSNNFTIRKITAAGVVTTLAGTAGSSGSADGTGAAARFYYPYGLAIDGSGNVYVADTNNQTIRKITSAGVVTTLAGTAGSSGTTNGTGSAARFSYPDGVAADNAGNVYVADSNADTIRVIAPGGVVTTLAGSGFQYGIADGTGSAARFNGPNALTVDTGGNIYVADTFNFIVRKVTAAGVVTTFAGTPPQLGSSDGTGTAARFNNPWSATLDGAGNLYVADTNNDLIRKVTSAGVVTTLAGSAGLYGGTDGTGAAARFGYPQGVVADAAGNIYVADTSVNLVRKITPGGVVTTLAGTSGQSGSVDGTGSAARFNSPQGIALDSSGAIYVADTNSHIIRKITGSAVTTLAGTAGQSGSADGTGSAARFAYPKGLAVDGAGNIYVADSSNNVVRKISPAGVVTTLAGTAGNSGSTDGTGSAARFSNPAGVAVDAAGIVYVADSGNYLVRKITPSGVVTTIGGTAGRGGITDGVGSIARFYNPDGIAVDSAGKLYVIDTGNQTIRLGVPTVPAGIVTQPQSTAPINVGASASFSVVATGDGTLTYQWAQNGTPLAGATSATLTIGSVQAANAGSYTVTVSNAVGSATSVPAILELIQTPILANLNAPTTISEITGQTVSLTAAATAYGNVTLQWYLGNAGDTTHPVAGATSATYTVPALGSTQNYWFKVTNEVGSVSSATVTVTVGASYSFTHLAGPTTGGAGSVDGVGTAASFQLPFGAAADTAGNIYVADTYNHTIRKITAAGAVTTFAGAPGQQGSADGVGTAARFYYPGGLAVDTAGNVYVADTSNHTIRKIAPNGAVTTVAGLAGQLGSADGTGSAARFYFPRGIVPDGSGNLYIADTTNHILRKISSSGVVTTIAGTAGQTGSIDGTGAAARFYYPASIAMDTTGTLYVADEDNHTIRKVTSAGVVTTVAGTAGQSGSADGTGAAARFYYPQAVVVDSTGTLYVSDTDNHTIRKITSTGIVTTLAGAAGQFGAADGTGAAARLYFPQGLTLDGTGNLYLADEDNHEIRKITAAGVVTTLAGTAAQSGSTDGVGSAARFWNPNGIAVDTSANVYVTDAYNNTVRKITPAGAVSTLAGTAGIAGWVDATGAAAQFRGPRGPVVDSAGNVYVADSGNYVIRKISPSGVVTTIAGTVGQSGSVDGPAATAQFGAPYGLALDPTGNLYVSDYGNATIRKIDRAGMVTTLAGMAKQYSGVDGVGTAARFYAPDQIAVDAAGNIYVADAGLGSAVRKITPAGAVTTLAGAYNQAGSLDGLGTAARFTDPVSVGVDSGGNVFVTDITTYTIRKISPAGLVTTVGGTAFLVGNVDGIGSTARFRAIFGPAIDSAGNLYVSDESNGTILKGVPVFVVAPSFTTQPQAQTALAGGTVIFTAVATGNPAPSYQWFKDTTAIAGATASTLTLTNVQTGDAATYSVTATSSAGTATSTGAMLTVNVPASVAITTQPVSQTTATAGGTVTFTVAASGTPAPTYQWYFNGAAIAGATNASLTLTNVQATSVGNYYVLATNSLGSVASSVVSFGIDQAGNSATHAVSGSGYVAGQTVTISNTLSYTGSPSALSWSVLLPDGWSFASSSGSTGNIGPSAGQTGELDWAWSTIPASPLTFTYTLNVPATATGPQQIVAMVGVRNGTSLLFLAQPDPLMVTPLQFHSADENQDGKISLLELTRVIELFNARNGTNRTGAYTVQAGTEDGFAPDPTRTASATVTLSQYHSADENQDGKISLLELTRVIELFNYRSGTTRTGQYHVQSGTEDGFAPGP